MLQVGRDAEYMLQVATNVRQVYLEGRAPFQDEFVHLWVFVYDFLSSWFGTLAEWSRRTANELDGWADLMPAEKRQRSLELFALKRPSSKMAPDMASLVDGVPALPGMWRRREPPVATDLADGDG
ncbi:MAG TPA: hypothetical protein VFW86_03025 [Candidatus Limnocylindrales bacterium]|nr:hypothetical protein [Candidatus Limnocylindrales bacterium]